MSVTIDPCSPILNDMINSLQAQVRELSKLLLSIEVPYKSKGPLPDAVHQYWDRYGELMKRINEDE